MPYGEYRATEQVHGIALVRAAFLYPLDRGMEHFFDFRGNDHETPIPNL